MKNIVLTGDLLLEIAKACIQSTNFLEVVRPHIKYSFLSEEPYKNLYKSIFDYQEATQKSPTLGILAQQHETDGPVLSLIAKLRGINVSDRKEQLLEALELYIRRKMFVELHKNTKELFEKNQKDEAITLLAEESAKILNFSLKSAAYTRIFRDFDKRQAKRKNQDISTVKCPSGIPPFDHHTRGGPEKGTSTLVIARSGTGKSTVLRWMGYSAAFRGLNVVHFQAEGKGEAVENAYDSMWTGIDLHVMKSGDIGVHDLKRIDEARKSFEAQCGEISVVPFEQFDTASISMCRKALIDILKTMPVDVIIFDYLEKFDPGNGKRYKTDAEGERARKQAVAEKITNMAVEFNVAAYTATQASDIKPDKYNDPEYVITRSDIANLKATIDCFAYSFTLNQTDDEYKNDIIRIHEEKLREYKIYEATYAVAQQCGVGRFLDAQRTNLEFWDRETKRTRRYAPNPKPARTVAGKSKAESK